MRDSVAQQLTQLRAESGLSLRHVAEAAGIDPAHLSRIEHRKVGVSLDVLVAVVSNLGAELGVRVYPTAGPRLRDRFQAPMIEALVRALDPRWRPVPEFPVPTARGVIDLALFPRSDGISVACEAQSELRSLDLVLRRLAEKTLALGDGSHPRTAASSLLLVRSTAQTRELARLHSATLIAAFPSRNADAYEALNGPDRPWPGPSLLWARLERGGAEILSAPPRGVHVGR